MPFAEIEDGRLHYTVNGSGSPLVLLHSAWASHKWWHWQQPELSNKYKVFAIDARGHGQSSPLQGVYSVEGFTKDLGLFLQKAEIDETVLIGWSMGGMIALQYCMDHPSKVMALILIASQAHRNPQLKRRLIFQYLLERLKLMMDFTAPRKYDRAAQKFPSAHAGWLERQVKDSLSPLATKEVFDWLMADITEEPRENFFNVIRSLWNWEADERLKHITAPTLIMVGDSDRQTPPRISRLLHQSIPNSRLTIVENASHYLVLERPDLVNTEILKFLKEVGY